MTTENRNRLNILHLSLCCDLEALYKLLEEADALSSEMASSECIEDQNAAMRLGYAHDTLSSAIDRIEGAIRETNKAKGAYL